MVSSNIRTKTGLEQKLDHVTQTLWGRSRRYVWY